ncbi:unnamed protein product [Lampetra planeri]
MEQNMEQNVPTSEKPSSEDPADPCRPVSDLHAAAESPREEDGEQTDWKLVGPIKGTRLISLSVKVQGPCDPTDVDAVHRQTGRVLGPKTRTSVPLRDGRSLTRPTGLVTFGRDGKPHRGLGSFVRSTSVLRFQDDAEDSEFWSLPTRLDELHVLSQQVGPVLVM